MVVVPPLHADRRANDYWKKAKRSLFDFINTRSHYISYLYTIIHDEYSITVICTIKSDMITRIENKVISDVSPRPIALMTYLIVIRHHMVPNLNEMHSRCRHRQVPQHLIIRLSTRDLCHYPFCYWNNIRSFTVSIAIASQFVALT